MIEPVAKTIAIITGICGLAAGVWAAGEYTGTRPVLIKEFKVAMDQLEQTSQAVLRIQFENLLAKRQQNGTLSYEEQKVLCQIAAALQYTNVPGC